MSAHEPIDIGERGLKIRSMLRKRAGPAEVGDQQRRRRHEHRQRDAPGDPRGLLVARQVAGQRHERRAAAIPPNQK
jgi:hypothetical protein